MIQPRGTIAFLSPRPGTPGERARVMGLCARKKGLAEKLGTLITRI